MTKASSQSITTSLLMQLDLARLLPQQDAGENFKDILGEDGQVLFCRGAKFHQDYENWASELFLSQYVDGPPMDLLIPLAGIRMTLEPGDIFCFDPAMPHALVPVGADGSGLHDRIETSFIISLDLIMTPRIREAFGVEFFRTLDDIPDGTNMLFSQGVAPPIIDSSTGEFVGEGIGPRSKEIMHVERPR